MEYNEINEIAQVFAETLKNKTGVTPLFYTDAYNAERIWDETLTTYPLWVADYGVDSPQSIGKWSEWAGFQYSDAGSVSGISGNVDLDRFTETVLLTEEESGKIGSLPFDDVFENDWYYNYILTSYRNGWMYGISSNTFAPNEPAARDMACLLYTSWARCALFAFFQV